MLYIAIPERYSPQPIDEVLILWGPLCPTDFFLSSTQHAAHATNTVLQVTTTAAEVTLKMKPRVKTTTTTIGYQAAWHAVGRMYNTQHGVG